MITISEIVQNTLCSKRSNVSIGVRDYGIHGKYLFHRFDVKGGKSVSENITKSNSLLRGLRNA